MNSTMNISRALFNTFRSSFREVLSLKYFLIITNVDEARVIVIVIVIVFVFVFVCVRACVE
jgi:hypothetical protein